MAEQLTFDSMDKDQQELIKRLDGWPQSFITIRYQTKWSFERAGATINRLLACGKIVKLWDGCFALTNQTIGTIGNQ